MGSVLDASVGALLPAFVAAIVLDLVKSRLSRRRGQSHRCGSPGAPDSPRLHDEQERATQRSEHFGLEVVPPVARHSIDGLYLRARISTGTLELFAIVDEQLLAECPGDTSLPHRLPAAASTPSDSNDGGQRPQTPAGGRRADDLRYFSC
jgi:hypothetical protein